MVRAVTVIMASVVGLTFLFGFGNVLSLGLRLGVPMWVAPLVAPAVDLSILGLLLGIRHLALAGASAEVLRPARRLLMFASAVTLALNVAEPVVAGEYGKAAFDAVGPLLLIGWAEVGPGLLQAIGANRGPQSVEAANTESEGLTAGGWEPASPRPEADANSVVADRPLGYELPHEDLLVRARHEDAVHRTVRQKPISAETLRVKLGSALRRPGGWSRSFALSFRRSACPAWGSSRSRPERTS
ncbi:hypothetical protein AB0E59_06270 [Lentzea sp. NPDC034063]|uniref:hypothetical protein n=1 Tax=Lentzea sp. NPDC034063 TaxID=3154912 RepID=UPI00340241D6